MARSIGALTVSGTGPEPGEYRVRVQRHCLRVSIRGSGAPVLLINGLGGSLSLWQAMHEDLSGFQVISFDAPGSGRSSTPRRAYTIGELAGIVAELLDKIGVERVDVVGYSFGGEVAQQFAHNHPGRVRRLVLGATACGWGGIPGDVLALLSIVTPIRYHSRRAYALTAPFLAGGAAEGSREFIERTAAARVHAPPAWSGYALQLMAAWSWSSLPWLHTLEHPTLVLTGAQDRLLPAVNSELIASRLQRARLLSIEGWGHYLLLDRNSGAGAAIAEFLTAERPEDPPFGAALARSVVTRLVPPGALIATCSPRCTGRTSSTAGCTPATGRTHGHRKRGRHSRVRVDRNEPAILTGMAAGVRPGGARGRTAARVGGERAGVLQPARHRPACAASGRLPGRSVGVVDASPGRAAVGARHQGTAATDRRPATGRGGAAARAGQPRAVRGGKTVSPALPGWDTAKEIKREIERTRLRAQKGIALLTRGEPPKVAPTPKDEVWAQGKARLWRYRGGERRYRPPLILFLGLFGRPYVLDLYAGTSIVEALVGEGFDVFLLDWGIPDAAEGDHNLDTYVDDYMPRAIAAAQRVSESEDVTLVPYCMGASLALLLLGSRDDIRARNLVLLTPPCDWSHGPSAAQIVREGRIVPEDLVDETSGIVPTSVLRVFFKLRNQPPISSST